MDAKEYAKKAIAKKIPEMWAKMYAVCRSAREPLADRLRKLRDAASGEGDGAAGDEAALRGGIFPATRTAGLTRFLSDTNHATGVPLRVARGAGAPAAVAWADRRSGVVDGEPAAVEPDDYALFARANAGEPYQLMHFAAMLGTEVHMRAAYVVHARDAAVATSMQFGPAFDGLYTRERVRRAHAMADALVASVDRMAGWTYAAVELPVWFPFAVTRTMRTIETRADAVLRHTDGGIAVVEYKTVPGDHTQRTRLMPGNRDTRQALLVALAFHVTYNIKPRTCVVAYVARGGQTVRCEFDYDPAHALLRDTVAQIFSAASPTALYINENVFVTAVHAGQLCAGGGAPLEMLRYIGHAVALSPAASAARAQNWTAVVADWRRRNVRVKTAGNQVVSVAVIANAAGRAVWTPQAGVGSLFRPGVPAAHIAGRRRYPANEPAANRAKRAQINAAVKRAAGDIARRAADGPAGPADKVGYIRAIHREANTTVAAAYGHGDTRFPHCSQRALQSLAALSSIDVRAAKAKVLASVLPGT